MSEIVFIKYHLHKHGGLEKYSLRIIDHYLKEGFKVTLLTTYVSNDFLDKNDIRVVLFKPFKLFKFLRIFSFDFKCKKWIKKNNPKIVFSFDRASIYSHTRLGNGLHKSYLKRRKLFEASLKSFLNKINPLHRVILRIENNGFKKNSFKKIITNSYMIKEELLSSYDIPNERIQVIHNGVEFAENEKFFNDWEKQKNKQIKKLYLKLTDFHFIFIGNDYKRKGLVTLLNALAIIENMDFHLSVIGKEKNIKKYKKLTNKLGLSKKVSFYGPRSNVISFYQLADAIVVPSYYDPFSNVAIEALSMGVYTIVSKFNGAKEILTPKTGTIVDILDSFSFSKTLQKAMENKKNMKRAIETRNSVEYLDFPKQLNTLIETVKFKI